MISFSPPIFFGPESGVEPDPEVSQTSLLTVTLPWPLSGIRISLLFLRRNLTLDPSNNLNLALIPIGIETLPFESILEIALNFSLVN